MPVPKDIRVIRFWKPYGVLTKFTDQEGRPTLADYIPEKGMYSIGRLDKDSEGLLLLTDNGTLDARLTHPQYKHPRTYWVQVERIPDENAVEQLCKGVEIKGGVTLPAQVRLLEQPPELPERSVPIRFRKNVPTAWLEMILYEGRNRQVRRMTAAVGYPTLRLVRWSIGELNLKGLEVGQYEMLDSATIDQLWQSAFKKR